MDERTRGILREGLIAGAIGATSVAIWFLLLDTIAGRPLFTPLVLGKAMISVLGSPPDDAFHLLDQPAVQLITYTVFHFVAFIAVGTLASLVLDWAHEEPSILLGFIILFVAFEIGFHGLVALLQHTTALGGLAWYQVMIGNLIAATAMGTYLWRAHPELADELAHAVD
ncbi:MAG TPA: hypothetical protein VMM18_13205 [Gemmatimonadaceae bacterium]|nr:hypothetical protein [Gemmatimonadaceae bacterium]